MRVIKWIIRGLLALLVLVVLTVVAVVAVFMLKPELLGGAHWNQEIGRGIARGMSYSDLTERWGAPGSCSPERRERPAEYSCMWLKTERRWT